MSQLSPLLAEVVAAIDLSKLDKEKLVVLLLGVIDPEELVEIINRHNDAILDKALDDTKAESRRGVSWILSAGRSTGHKLMDNFVANAIRKNWPR